MALQAFRNFAADKPVKLVEVQDLSVPRAITFAEGDDSGVDTLVRLTEIRYHQNKAAAASFSCYSLPIVATGSKQGLELMVSATMNIILGSSLGSTSVNAPLCAPLEDLS